MRLAYLGEGDSLGSPSGHDNDQRLRTVIGQSDGDGALGRHQILVPLDLHGCEIHCSAKVELKPLLRRFCCRFRLPVRATRGQDAARAQMRSSNQQTIDGTSHLSGWWSASRNELASARSGATTALDSTRSGAHSSNSTSGDTLARNSLTCPPQHKITRSVSQLRSSNRKARTLPRQAAALVDSGGNARTMVLSNWRQI